MWLIDWSVTIGTFQQVRTGVAKQPWRNHRDVPGAHASPGSSSNDKERTWVWGWNGFCELKELSLARKRGQKEMTEKRRYTGGKSSPTLGSMAFSSIFQLHSCARGGVGWIVPVEGPWYKYLDKPPSILRELEKSEKSNKFDIPSCRQTQTARKFILPASKTRHTAVSFSTTDSLLFCFSLLATAFQYVVVAEDVSKAPTIYARCHLSLSALSVCPLSAAILQLRKMGDWGRVTNVHFEGVGRDGKTGKR